MWIRDSNEESLTRSEVARAALRAVREARNYIDYGSCGRRGKWGTATQRALQDDLTDAYIRGIGKLYMGRYQTCLLYTSPSPRGRTRYRMHSSA